MKHGADEFDAGWLVWILLLELHDESESAIFEGRISWADDYRIPELELMMISKHSFGSYQVITLSATGEADTPAGGSVCIRYILGQHMQI